MKGDTVDTLLSKKENVRGSHLKTYVGSSRQIIVTKTMKNW